MSRTTVDLRPPELAVHGIAGRELALNIPVTGGVLTSPVLSMKTSTGEVYTTDPGVGAASMVDPTTLRLLWTSADMSALNTTTREKVYRIEVAGAVDGGASASVIGGLLHVYPTTWARRVPFNAATLTLNNGSSLELAVTVPPPDGPVDGGTHDEVFPADLPVVDGGDFDDSFTDTTYDGGTI